MLQLPVPELKMRTVSISHLTRQLYTVSACFLTPVCSKHLSPCSCISSYQGPTAWLCQPQPQPAPARQPHSAPGRTLPSPLILEKGSDRGNGGATERKQDNPCYAPQPCQPLPGARQSWGAEFVPPPGNTPCFPPAIFVPVFICSCTLAPAIAKLCWQQHLNLCLPAAVLENVNKIFTFCFLFLLSAGMGMISYQLRQYYKKKKN